MSRRGKRAAKEMELPPGATYEVINQSDEVRDDVLGEIRSKGPVEVNSPEGLEYEMRILGMILMPEEFDAMLYSDSFSTEKMCKRSLKQRDACTWVLQPPDALKQLPPTEQFIASNRGNGCGFARYFYVDPNSGQQPITYTLANTKNRGNSNYVLQLQPTTNFLDFNIADCSATALTAGGMVPGSQKAQSLYTAQMVCGRSTSKMPNARWVLISAVTAPPVGQLSTITVTPSSALAQNCEFWLFRWNGNQPTFVQAASMAAGSATAAVFQLTGDIGYTDFYTLQYEGDPLAENFVPSTNRGFTVQVNSFCAQLVQRPVKSFFENILQFGDMTAVAASLRMTDMAAPLNLQGEIVISTLRTNGYWYRVFSACLGGGAGAGSPFSTNASYRDSYLGKLMYGGYAWHLPFKNHQFELESCCVLDYSTASILDVFWDLEDESIWNVFTARTTNNGQNTDLTGLGAECWLTVVTSYNWTTDNDFPDADYAEYGYTVWSAALGSIRFVPRTMSNAFHIGSLMKWLIDKGKVGLKYAGPLLKIGGRAVAEHFLGKEITNDGIKLLNDAYKVGDAITGRLKGGGM